MKKANIQLLHFIASRNSDCLIDIISEDRVMSRSAYSGFMNYFEEIDFCFHNIKVYISDLRILFSNNCTIRFLDFKNEDNVRGTNRDFCFVRFECNLDESMYKQLKSRTSKLFISEGYYN